MCARYAYFSSGDIARRFEIREPIGYKINKSYNIGPGSINPTVIRQSPNSILMMKFGLVPYWAKDPSIGYKMFNARSENIENKPSFRKPIKSQRCLIPCDGFYEWMTVTLEDKPEKVPWYFSLKDKSTFSLAGIFDVWKDAEQKETYSFAIITTTPNELIAKVHDRMPVILSPEDEDKWLDKETTLEDVKKILKPLPADLMAGWPVSQRVNKVSNNSSDLIRPFSYPNLP